MFAISVKVYIIKEEGQLSSRKLEVMSWKRIRKIKSLELLNLF